MKMPKFGTENALFRYFWNRTLKKLLSYLKSAPSNFVTSESLTHTVNFSIGSAFFKGLDSVFSEGLGPGPLYKVYC